QEELQRVGRRLGRRHGRRRWRWRRGLLRFLEHLDAALVKIAVDRVCLEQPALERLQDLQQLGVPDRPRLFSSLEQLLELLVGQEGVQLDRRHTRLPNVPLECSLETPHHGVSGLCTLTRIMSSPNSGNANGPPPYVAK